MKNNNYDIKPLLIQNGIGKKVDSRFLISMYGLIICLLLSGSSLTGQSPISSNGKLNVSGTQLVNKNGSPIQLRGMSSHGTQWYTEDYNFNSLSVMVNKWGIDLFRIAMYPTDKPDNTKNAYEGNPAFWRGYIDNLVDICGSLGIYCIIDWHVLNPGDPNDPTYLPMAKEFWDYMSKKHAGKNHVLYEICNEPNGVSWSSVKSYANTIIPIIRANDPNSIIIVGSPTWSSDVDIAANDPIKDPADATKLAKNVMYSFHFYAASHGQNYRDKITAALSKGLPIFATEWGSTDASGGGSSNWTETQIWIDFLAANKISWTNWSYSDKSETSAVLLPGSGASLLWDNTNTQGDRIKTYIATPADSWTSSGNWSPAAYIATPLNGDYFLPGTAVTFTSTAVDKDGTIAGVDFLVDGVKIGTSSAAPYSVQWTPATVKDYVVTAVVKDNAGATGTSIPFTYHVVQSINETAFPNGTPWPVPGDISCVNFDNGGEMIAYHDLDGVHKGPSGSSRSAEGVDVEGNSNIGYVLTGEWLKYTVNVANAGSYDFTLQTASGLPGTGKFHLESNGVPISAITDVPSSGNWGSYQPVVVKNIALNAGKQVIKLCIDRGNFNFSTMNFKFTGGSSYSITASAGTGGTITPSGTTMIPEGGSQSYTIQASSGYKILDVTVDNISKGAIASYTFTNVTANHTIKATFEGGTAYTIMASAGTGGTITPSGAVSVNKGAGQTFTIAASNGYSISNVTVNGISQGAISTYTFSNVTANQTIEASFSAQSCNLLTYFSVPRATALPTIANSSYRYIYVLGVGGPNLANVTNFTINWDLPNKGLWQLSMNTNNGVPTWWLNLLPKITHTFASGSPACSITGSGIPGLDGDYWVNLDGANFVMVSKTGSFAIYGSSSVTPPVICSAKSGFAKTYSKNSTTETTLSVFPSVLEKGNTLNLKLPNVYEHGTLIIISDMSGRIIYRTTVRENFMAIPIDSKYRSGIYNITITDQTNTLNARFLIK